MESIAVWHLLFTPSGRFVLCTSEVDQDISQDSWWKTNNVLHHPDHVFLEGATAHCILAFFSRNSWAHNVLWRLICVAGMSCLNSSFCLLCVHLACLGWCGALSLNVLWQGGQSAAEGLDRCAKIYRYGWEGATVDSLGPSQSTRAPGDLDAWSVSATEYNRCSKKCLHPNTRPWKFYWRPNLTQLLPFYPALLAC